MSLSPSLRRRRLARHLLKLRGDSGLTVDAVAKEARRISPAQKWSAAKITRIESRKRQRLTEAEVTTLLDVYGVTDSNERAAYAKLVAESALTGWWTAYADVVGKGAYVDMETEAQRLRTFEPLVLPGLLQTPEYTRAILRGGAVTDEQEVNRRLEVRMMRRQLLDRPNTLTITAIIDEAAIRKIPAAVRTEQLRHLVDIQKRPNVDIRIVPDDAGPHPGMHGAFVLMDFPHDPSLVYLEQSMGGLFLEEDKELTHYEAAYVAIQDAALSTKDSVAFLKQQISLSQSP